MKLSILIVNWNTKDLLVECLNSIFRNEPIFESEVIVVDNASSDGSFKAVRDRFGGKANVKIIAAQENLGFARANNLAFEQSSGEYILLLNPDTEIKHQALQSLVHYMDSHNEIGVLGPKLINPDGSLQPSVRRFPDILSSLLIFSYLHHVFRPKKYLMDKFDYSKTSEVDQVMGAAFLTRRDVVEKLGFLDENFWLWLEEVDFCLRVKKAGYKIIFYPHAIVMHHGGESFSQLNIYKRKKTFARSLIYYFEKHRKWWEVWLLKIIMPLVLIAAWIVDKLVTSPSSPSPTWERDGVR